MASEVKKRDPKAEFNKYRRKIEVVRCKDCTHGSPNEDGSISCDCFMADGMPPTGYCSFGEKRVRS